MEFKVPWSGVGAQYTQEEVDVVIQTMKTADPLTQGTHQKEFEENFNSFIGSKKTFAVSSCTSALQLCADLLEIKNGDEVIVPAHTFCASAIPFAKAGAKIVWADINKDSRLITAETIKSLITSNTKAVVVVHLYGQAVDMDPIIEICNKDKILVIEDAAQAPGAKYKDRRVGSIGDFGCFSFHTHKNISTLGEGGALTVNNQSFLSKISGLRHNGLRSFEKQEEYWLPAMSNVDFDIIGMWPNNFCLGEVQCALANKMISRIDKMNSDRKERAKQFISALKDYPELSFQKPDHSECENVFHLLVAQYDNKSNTSSSDFFRSMAYVHKIKVINPYYPLYKYPIFQKSGMGKANCPNTEYYFDRIVAFPFHHWMPEAQFNYMLESTIKTLNKLRG